MQFKIKEEEKKDPDITLFLETTIGGEIDLMGVDSNGNEEIIMSFEDGKFIRGSNVELNGMQTDDKGKIIEEE